MLVNANKNVLSIAIRYQMLNSSVFLNHRKNAVTKFKTSSAVAEMANHLATTDMG